MESEDAQRISVIVKNHTYEELYLLYEQERKEKLEISNKLSYVDNIQKTLGIVDFLCLKIDFFYMKIDFLYMKIDFLP